MEKQEEQEEEKEEEGESEGEDQDEEAAPEKNEMAVACNLIDNDEAIRMKELLKVEDRRYVPVSQEYHHCLFEAILCNMYPPVAPDLYTAYHLRLQTCMFMVKNHKVCTHLLKHRLQSCDTSLYHFILKFLNFKEWGEENLIPVICKMWKISISVLDPTYPDLVQALWP